MVYDCLIIGGGPAGLNAALVLGRARKNVLLADNNQARNRVTHASHGFITRDGVHPDEFKRIALEDIQRYPSVQYMETEVTSIARGEQGFEVSIQPGERMRARKIVLATGLKEAFPAIEGLHQFYGKSLFNCPFCDGWEMRDQPLVVVSEDPIVLRKAGVFYIWSKDLVICTNGHRFTTDEQKDRLLAKGIQVMETPISSFYGHEGMLEQVRFADGTQIARSGGFVTPKWVPKADFHEQLGYATNEFGGVETDSFGRSTVQGVYAAGDAAYVMPSQLIYAASDGSKVAATVTMDLVEEDFS